MASDRDPDLPPASDDDAVQAFLDIRWRDSMRAAREGMSHLRDIWPEFNEHIPETGHNALSRALNDFESAYASLNRAGKFILGEAEYDRYLQTLAARKQT